MLGSRRRPALTNGLLPNHSHMNAHIRSVTDLSAKRSRLAREIVEVESKAARLRAALHIRQKNLARLDAQIAINGNDARGPKRHA